MTEEEKLGVVLVVIDNEKVEQALERLDLEQVTVLGIVIDDEIDGENRVVRFNGEELKRFQFHGLGRLKARLGEGNDFAWLICEPFFELREINRIKKFLTANGIKGGNIINGEIFDVDTVYWIANLRFAEKYPTDFFVTGNNFVQFGIDLNCFSPYKGINLACNGQDLRQSFFVAQNIFSHTALSPKKFVLIDLSPNILNYDCEQSYSMSAGSFKYALTLRNYVPEYLHGKMLQGIINAETKQIFLDVTEQQADLNFDKLKSDNDRVLQADDFVNWKTSLGDISKEINPAIFENNCKILESYIRLCIANGAKPIGVTLPVAPIIRKKFDPILLEQFRNAIERLKTVYKFKHIDLFDMPIEYKNFGSMTCLNSSGAKIVSEIISNELREEKFLPVNTKTNASEGFNLSGDNSPYALEANSIIRE